MWIARIVRGCGFPERLYVFLFIVIFIDLLWKILINFYIFLFFSEKCLKTDIVVANGFFSESEYAYPVNKETQYKCKPGYVTADGKTSGLITCLQNGWSAQPVCISK